MKKVNLLCVGKIKEKYLRDGIDEYAKRLQRYCSFCITELPDVSGADEVKIESDALLAKMKGYVILCDILNIKKRISMTHSFEMIFKRLLVNGHTF